MVQFLESQHRLRAFPLLPISVLAASSPQEGYRSVPMPPGVRVQATELEGPVFADGKGRTLYRWPLGQLRNGPTGDPPGKSECNDERTEVSVVSHQPLPGRPAASRSRGASYMRCPLAAVQGE